MRVLRWAAGLTVAVWVVLELATSFSARSLPIWVAILPATVFVVLAAATAIDQARKHGLAGNVRRTLGPGVRGLGEVQDMRLGRKPGITVTYGSDEPQVAELVVRRVDDLDQAVWTVGGRPDGDVEISVRPADGSSSPEGPPGSM